MKVNSAKFVKEIVVVDPDSGGDVALAVFKHNQAGGMFAVDSSFIDQCTDEDEPAMIADPFNNDALVELEGV